MNFKKILPKLLSIAFLAMLIFPLSAGATKEINTKAKNNEGCKNFSTVKSDNCESGLICEIVNFTDTRFSAETTNCSKDGGATTGACDGACISVSDQGFGLDASNFGRAGLSQSKDLKGTIARIINIALGFLGIIAVVFILMGGFKMMTAAGNEDQTADGKKAIMGGVIGLVIIFAAWGIASFVISSLQSSTAGGGGTATTGGSGGNNQIIKGRCIYDPKDNVDSDANVSCADTDGNGYPDNLTACCNDATLANYRNQPLNVSCTENISEEDCINLPHGNCKQFNITGRYLFEAGSNLLCTNL